MAKPRADAPEIITTRQARALVELMDVFYSDPRNVAAYEAWKKEREKESA